MLVLDPNIQYYFKCKQCKKILERWSDYVRHIKCTKHLGCVLLVVDVSKGEEL